MSKLTLLIPILILICTSVQASEIEHPKDLEGRLTVSAFDYHKADPSTWSPVSGGQLVEFLSHRWFGGVYIEEKPPLGQWRSILLLGRKGKRFTSQGLGEDRPDRGDLSINEDRYCVRWKGYGKLCYKVMAGELLGKPVHLITRESGKIWAGIELLIASGEPKIESGEPKKVSPEEGHIERRLEKLKGLYDKGLITKDEYDKKRAEILEAL